MKRPISLPAPIRVICQRCALLVAVLLAALTTVADAQGSLHGIVISAETGIPVEGAAVSLDAGDGPAYATVTDRNGFYQIGGIRAATYSLAVRHFSFAPLIREVSFVTARSINLDLRLEPSALQIEGVTVSGERGLPTRSLGRQEIRPAELRLAPTPGGSGDMASYLQTLPGVTTTGDRGGQMFIRGGSAAENLVLVDGVPVYQPFHILGFYSILPADLLRSADFYPGGFGARYVGRTSSVLDVALRDGDPTRLAASASVSSFVAEARVEGPAGPGISWLVSARRSLIDETSRALLGTRQPLTFESQLAKLTVTDEEDLRCSVLALRSVDRGQMDVEDTGSYITWENRAVGGRCVTSFERILRLLEVTFSFSSLDNESASRGSSGFSSRVWRMQHDAHTTSMIGAIPVYAGYQLYTELMDYDLREIYGLQLDDGDIFGVSAYMEGSLPLGPLEVRPGVVLMGEPRASIEPRLRVAWQPLNRPSEVIHGAFGMYSQDIGGTSDLRDVGSVFTAWLETPDDEPIRAWHSVLGWQQTIGGRFNWSLEGYYKRLRSIPVPVWRANAEFTTKLSRADGEAYGADLQVDYVLPNARLFASYGYGWTQYQASQAEFADWYGEAVQRYHPPHDRRHQVNVAATGRLAGIDLSARWQFGSGLPFTRTMGFDDAFNFGELPHDVSQEIGDTRMIIGRPFNARMPLVHRLDISGERAFRVRGTQVGVQAGLVNAYDRRNLFYYDLFTGRRVDQLPFAPYVGIVAKLP